jgi:hypothetical protein
MSKAPLTRDTKGTKGKRKFTFKFRCNQKERSVDIIADNYPEACCLLGIKQGDYFKRYGVPVDFFADFSVLQEGMPV